MRWLVLAAVAALSSLSVIAAEPVAEEAPAAVEALATDVTLALICAAAADTRVACADVSVAPLANCEEIWVSESDDTLSSCDDSSTFFIVSSNFLIVSRC